MDLITHLLAEAPSLRTSALDVLVARLLPSESSLPEFLGHFKIGLEEIPNLLKQSRDFAHVL
jgi:hypothetical protein